MKSTDQSGSSSVRSTFRLKLCKRTFNLFYLVHLVLLRLQYELTDRGLTLGILAPRFWYCSGFFRKLTNSRISSLASSQPATSLNFTSMLSFIILAVDSLMLKGPPLPPPPPPIGPRRSVTSRKPMSSRVGTMLSRKELRTQNVLSYITYCVYTVEQLGGCVHETHPSLSVL